MHASSIPTRAITSRKLRRKPVRDTIIMRQPQEDERNGWAPSSLTEPRGRRVNTRLCEGRRKPLSGLAARARQPSAQRPWLEPWSQGAPSGCCSRWRCEPRPHCFFPVAAPRSPRAESRCPSQEPSAGTDFRLWERDMIEPPRDCKIFVLILYYRALEK